MKRFLYLLLVFCAARAQAQPNIQFAPFVSGFNKPVDITHAGDDRLFIVEQPGRIMIIENGVKLPLPFLDIQVQVNDSGNERGLLGLAFHPDYAQNGYFYVNYTGDGGDTFISRFSVSATDPNLANAGSELILLTIDQPYSNHNGGDLAFGPDGYLYIGMGDGGSGGDPINSGQTTNTLLGKMLRIDVNSEAEPLNYGIPPDNPFTDPNDGIRDEIWALGMRNPWRFSFDKFTGDLWIADVGQDAFEEINFQPAGSPGGENYGWRCYEGNQVFNSNGCGPIAQYTFPIAVYQHSGTVGCSVTGGFVYRGCQYPALYGWYLYADYCTGRLWGLAPSDVGGWVNPDLGNYSNFQYTTFGEDRNGELYIAAHGEGTIYQVTETSQSFSVSGATVAASCEEASNGAITLTFTPAQDTVTFLWSNGATDLINHKP